MIYKMSKLPVIILITLSLGFFACNSSNDKGGEGQAKIEFSETSFDFGNVKSGEKVSHRFIFKNTGTSDLIIKNVDPSCGCTVVSFPNVPVKPGDSSYIEATFDSDGYRGLNIKEVEVKTNGKPAIINLTLSATVQQNIQ
jgi:hypothetical protein